VGYGVVTAPAVIAKEFDVEAGPLLAQQLVQPGLARNRDDPKLAEYVVRVEWKKDVAIVDAKKFDGMFANSNIVCKLREPKTLEFLREQFGVIPD
jgi:hypothetical protein